jgi:hypothetical protein
MLWWDPVGVYGLPEAISEYDDDVGQVGRLLREGAGEEQVAAYFSEHDFGVGPHRDADRLAARKVVEWFTRSMERLSELQKHR